MTDLVVPDAASLAEAAAGWIVDTFTALPGPIAICLSGGSTPKRLYETLAKPSFANRMPWRRMHFFWGDERFVPPDDQRSNQLMVRRALLDHVPVPAANIHPIQTAGATPEEAAHSYDAALRGFRQAGRPLFDLVLMGLGTNGHTASLFPHESVLTERTAWAAAGPGGTACRPEQTPACTKPSLQWGWRARASPLSSARWLSILSPPSSS